MRRKKPATSLSGKQDLWLCWDLLKRNIIRFCFVFSLRNLCTSINYSSIQDLRYDRVKMSVTVLSIFPCSSKQSCCAGVPNDPRNVVLFMKWLSIPWRDGSCQKYELQKGREGKLRKFSELRWETSGCSQLLKAMNFKKEAKDSGHTEKIKMFFPEMCLLAWNWPLRRPRGMMLTVDCPAGAWVWPSDCSNEL